MGHCCKFWLIAVLSVLNFLVTDAVITSLESTIRGKRTTMAQEGCEVVLTCMGEGTTVEWRIFGVRDPLASGNNIMVQNPLTAGNVTGKLTFTSIRESNTGAYTCTIADVTRTIRITVRNAVIVEPGNSEYDISDHTIGDTLPVLCRIESCVTINSVAVRTETVELTETAITDTQQDPQLNLDVTNDLQGQHHCHVTYMIDGQTMTRLSMPFNITGTPTEPPTTQKDRNGATTTGSFFSFVLFSLTVFMALLH